MICYSCECETVYEDSGSTHLRVLCDTSVYGRINSGICFVQSEKRCLVREALGGRLC
jgi:hypothetical protein